MSMTAKSMSISSGISKSDSSAAQLQKIKVRHGP